MNISGKINTEREWNSGDLEHTFTLKVMNSIPKVSLITVKLLITKGLRLSKRQTKQNS